YFLGIVYEFLYDGVFQWFYRIFDIGGNSIDTGNYTYTLDTIIPGIFFGVGTQDNYSNLSQNFIYVNVSVNETNEANITFGLYNSSGDVNITIFTDLTRTINWTGLSDGNYSYNVSIYDESLQFNFTETRDITLDTTPSEVTLNFPQNTSYNYTNILFNVSTNEISYCNYSVDLGSTNYSMNTTDNFNFNSTQNLTGGNYSVIYYCYDLLNNLNNSMNISFTVDFTYPLIEYSGGTLGNNSNVSQSFIFVNVTVNETNEVNISFRLHDSDSQVNLTTYTDNGRTINWTGLNDGNYSFNVTTTDIVSNINTTETRYVILDDTYPNANLSLPLNGSITGDTIQNLTVNLSDNIELDNATLFVINSSDSIINQTAFNLSSSIYFLGIVYNFSYDGDFEWFYRVVDIAGNSNDTENFSITIDTSFPGVEFGFGTQLAGANLTDDFIYVNVSVNENNEANITFRLFNSTNTVNTTNYSTPVRTINWTNLPNEKYRYDVTVYDTFDRMNATELRTINLDNTNPNANLSTPLNETFTGITTQNLTVNLSDNIELDNATLFILNSSDSIINQTTQNLSGTTYFLGIIYEFLYDGLFQWFYRVFDISGNFIDTSNYTIRLDTAFPQIEFSDTTENNYSNVSQNNVFIQVSVVEGNEVNITFLLHNSSGQVFKNTFTNQQRIINWTPLINGNYSYNVTVVDSSDQVNFTETRIITLDTNGPNITNVGDTPDPIIWSENLSISSNITDSLLYVNFVFVELNGSNYTMNFMGGDHYKAIINTSNLNFTIIYNYTVYSNDSINNFNNQTGQVKVVQELNNPQINWINDTPDPVTFGSNFNVTANVTDDVNVTLVWVEIGGSNYTMLNYTNSVYNVTVSSLNVGIGNYNYTVYAKDNSENINSSVGNITINEGSFINDVVVRAANPDPIDNIHQGRYSVVIFNPSNNSVNITSVNINATSATGDVWDEITLGSNNSYPETGWSLSGTKLVSWSGLYVLNGGDAIGFFVNISSDDTGETFNISYDATINGTLYVDPHSHNTLESSTGGTPFVQLSFNTTGSWYNDSIKGNNNKTIYISLIESSNDGQIPNDVQMTIVVPEEFSNIVNVGGTGWGVPNITDNIIIVNTTQIVQSGLITYAFNVTAPAGSAAQGLYLLTASLAGADARAEFEGAIKVFDGIAPEIIIYEPSDLQNVSGHIVNPFNYSVSDSSSLLSCSLYGNWSGSFEINQTVSTPVRDTVNNFSYVDVTNDGLYIWNIECSDIYGNTGFFTTNFTFGSYLIPTEVSLFNISQTNNNGTGNITLVWNASNSTFKYLIYQSDEINGSFSLVNETTSNNYTDTNFSGLMRRFYRVDSWNPIGQNNTGRLFGSHVYTLRHNGNTRNWLGFPTNFSYLKFANETLSEITNATSVSMINVTNQKKITCNLYSCPSSIECTDSNCNFSFNMGSGLSYEVNINSSAPGEINWSGVGIVNNPIDIDLVKNSSSYGKNWISMYANTTLKGAKNISDNISNMETITIWNSSSQRSIGLIKNPFLGLPYLGIDFTFNMEDGFEVSVNASETWTQI
ncbi:hypothetical protein GOV12_03520, partial [Candidatus Pacearchaeota archaeon]|nr:hypothetical protein [Candidatus Pacearchaeota archaeon]